MTEKPRYKGKFVTLKAVKTAPPFVSSEVETLGTRCTSLDFARDERVNVNGNPVVMVGLDCFALLAGDDLPHYHR